MQISYSGGANPNGYVRIGSGGAFDTFVKNIGSQVGISTSVMEAVSSVSENATISSLKAFGGLSLNLESALQFATLSGINNVDIINLNGPAVPLLNINASTISLGANNVKTNSLSTIQFSTSALQFSTATSVGSNTNFNYPLTIDYDQAGNAGGGVAIAVQGHNFGTGAVINRIEMGTRGSGESYIMSVWPGHNLEDLYIDATDVTIRDSDGFSTIINANPYGVITNGGISAPQLLVSSVQGISLSSLTLNVSSINATSAQPAFTNNLMLSTMQLYNASTTLMYWDSASPSSNINTSGYDAVVGVNGTYKIGVSYQFISAGSPNEVEFFVLKNNNVISRSGGIVEVQNNQEIVEYAEILESCVNGDIIQAGCYTTGAGVYVSTINGSVIQSPAVILTMYRVDTV